MMMTAERPEITFAREATFFECHGVVVVASGGRHAAARGGAAGVAEPSARPVDTFVGGSIVFVFGANTARDGYEIVTMYPQPPDDKEQG